MFGSICTTLGIALMVYLITRSLYYAYCIGFSLLIVGSVMDVLDLGLTWKLVAVIVLTLIWVSIIMIEHTRMEPFGKRDPIPDESLEPSEGELIRVEHWPASRTTSVRYCGQAWKAILRDGSPSEPGMFHISSIMDDCLVLEKA
jgi:membrane protein implicated in regulation of membrane protease activity